MDGRRQGEDRIGVCCQKDVGSPKMGGFKNASNPQNNIMYITEYIILNLN